MKAKFKKIILFISVLSTFILTNFLDEKVEALSDGAYIVNTVTSYANPETGKIEDGGTANSDLGESMSRNVIGKNALLEIQNGKYFVTIRLALASNCSNIRFNVEPSRGSNSFYEVSNENTGFNTSNDTRDYRFEVEDPNTIISPVIYVTPMGRDVKFYAYLDMGSSVNGKGDFASKVTVNNKEQKHQTVNNQYSNNTNVSRQEEITQANNEAEEKKKEEDNRPKNIPISSDELLNEVEGIEEYKVNPDQKEETSFNNKVITMTGIGVIGVIALGVYGFYIKRIRN